MSARNHRYGRLVGLSIGVALLAGLASPALATQPGGERFPIEAGLVVGPVVALAGRYVYRSAYEITRNWERRDAIGSRTPSSEVEPTESHVRFMRGVGVVGVLVGGGWLLAAVVWLLA